MSLKQNKNFKSILGLGLFTNIGDSLFFIVTMWYVANNSDVAIYAGLAVFLFTLPETLLIFFGPLVDRFNPKRILAFSATGQILVHLIIIVLFITSMMTIPMLLLLLFISAICSSITYPVEETMLPQIVENDELVRANSIFTVVYKLSDSLFDGIAGIILVVGTVSLIYEANLLVFLIPLLMLKFLKFQTNTEELETFDMKSYTRELKEGISFVSHSKIKFILLPLAFLNFFTAVNTVALPFFADELTSSPSTYGFLLAFSGAGSMIGALMVNKIQQVLSPGKILTYGLLANGLLWFFMTISTVPYVAFVFIFLANFWMGAYNIIFASLFQVLTPVHLLGRMNTTVDSVITIAMPIGALLGGIIIDVMPLRVVMALNAVALVFTSITYFVNKDIYRLDAIDQLEPIEYDQQTQGQRT
ncbi:MFS transporter [uncultured Marinococcus sp.]|uniref:MFS transporter n=1 Tax=uncultured Marinococcus sp. TaxID=487012 RepID=UPI002619A03A|nr:MFS transporter [uncultured Marinococcus sp.]